MLRLNYKLLFVILLGSILSCTKGNDVTPRAEAVGSNGDSMKNLSLGSFDFGSFGTENLEGHYNSKYQVIVIEHSGGNPILYDNRGGSISLLITCKTDHFLGFDQTQDYAFFTYENLPHAAAIPVANLAKSDCTPLDTLSGKLYFSANGVIESLGERANYVEFRNGSFSKILTLEKCHRPIQDHGCQQTYKTLVSSSWYSFGNDIVSIETRSKTGLSPFEYILKYWKVVNGKVLKSDYKVFQKNYENQTQYDSGNLGGKQRANSMWIRNFLYLSLRNCLQTSSNERTDIEECIDEVYQSEIPLHLARANGGEIWSLTTRYFLYDTLDSQFHLWDLKAREEVKNDQMISGILSELKSLSPESIPRRFQVISENQLFFPKLGRMLTLNIENQTNPLTAEEIEIKYIDQSTGIGFVQDTGNASPYIFKAVPLKN